MWSSPLLSYYEHFMDVLVGRGNLIATLNCWTMSSVFCLQKGDSHWYSFLTSETLATATGALHLFILWPFCSDAKQLHLPAPWDISTRLHPLKYGRLLHELHTYFKEIWKMKEMVILLKRMLWNLHLKMTFFFHFTKWMQQGINHPACTPPPARGYSLLIIWFMFC